MTSLMRRELHIFTRLPGRNLIFHQDTTIIQFSPSLFIYSITPHAEIKFLQDCYFSIGYMIWL